jgi:transposase
MPQIEAKSPSGTKIEHRIQCMDTPGKHGPLPCTEVSAAGCPWYGRDSLDAHEKAPPGRFDREKFKFSCHHNKLDSRKESMEIPCIWRSHPKSGPHICLPRRYGEIAARWRRKTDGQRSALWRQRSASEKSPLDILVVRSTSLSIRLGPSK